MSQFLSSEELYRIGYYAGAADRLLGDRSYWLRYLGKAETITREDYSMMVAEITERLVAAGHLSPDEDLLDRQMGKRA